MPGCPDSTHPHPLLNRVPHHLNAVLPHPNQVLLAHIRAPHTSSTKTEPQQPGFGGKPESSLMRPHHLNPTFPHPK